VKGTMDIQKCDLEYMNEGDLAILEGLVNDLVFAFIDFSDHTGKYVIWDRKYSGIYGRHISGSSYYGAHYDRIILRSHPLRRNLLDITKWRGAKVSVKNVNTDYITEIKAYTINLEKWATEAREQKQRAIKSALQRAKNWN